MTRPIDLGRRCLPLSEWPLSDRLCWEQAVAPGSLLDDQGCAHHWRLGTRSMVISGYGRWLGWLTLRDSLDPTARPAERVTPKALHHYIQDLSIMVAPVTLASRIRDLAEALRVMDPDHDTHWIATIANRLTTRAVPVRNKRARLQPSASLFSLGIRMMEVAEADQKMRSGRRASRFRDGLIIAFLAVRPIRRAALVRMELGRHLIIKHDSARFSFAADEVKEARPDERLLPDMLVAPMQRYLDHWRPVLLAGHSDNHVWISAGARRLSADRLYDMIRRTTRAAYGEPMSPHMFRDAAVTSIALTAPGEMGLARSVLNHASAALLNQHYNQAKGAEAQREHALAMTTLRIRVRRAHDDEAERLC